MGNTILDLRNSKAQSLGFRDRQRTTITGSDVSYYWFDVKPTKPQLYAAGSSSRVIDTNHPGWYSWNRLVQSGMGSPALRNVDYGASFAKESVSLTMPPSVTVTENIGTSSHRGWVGVLAPSVSYRNAMQNIASGAFPGIPSNLGNDALSLWALGSTAIARSIPDIPEFSLFRFVGELREGLPKIPLKLLTKEKKLRNAGGEYLNFQFGIMPLVSDLQNFIEALQHPHFRSAVKHELGKEFRVRKVIDKGQSSTTTVMPFNELVSANGLSGNAGTVTTYQSYRIWSSCSFAYHQIDRLDQLLAELDDQMGGLGAMPTAIDIWNLVPWSWLVDWFSNFNHVMTNLSYLGRDGLYLRRGYIMAHYNERQVSQQQGKIYGKPFVSTGVRNFDRKYRVRASPFGFGLTYKDFNPFQLSILGALGLNRLKF